MLKSASNESSADAAFEVKKQLKSSDIKNVNSDLNIVGYLISIYIF